MRLLIFSVFLSTFFACSNNDKKEPVSGETGAAAQAVAPPVVAGKLAGNWLGFLGDNKLTLQLLEIKGSAVTGKSVAAGNYRDVKGTVEETADRYLLKLEEPGDDKYDGSFDITIKKEGMVCEGKWQPFNKQLAAKSFTLVQKTFVYKPDAGTFPEASMRLLKEDDLANYTEPDLRMMRNTIYARHGYSFKMKDMRSEFDPQEWYMPVSTDVRGSLTAIEKKNEVLIKRFEKYAAEYYDDFGR